MKYRSEFENLTNEEIDQEIKEREEMMKQMVGSLYPSIMCGEIETLLEMKQDPLRLARVLIDEKTKNRPY